MLADVERDLLLAQTARLESLRPDSAWAVTADVGTERGNAELVLTADELLSRDGSGIDLFFANAGVGTGGFLESTSEADWQLAFAVNVHAHRWAAERLVPLWLERGGGYFCSTASAAGLLAQIGSAPYSVTKHAAVAFAEWLAISYGDRGVKVSCLCPQGVNTAMLNGGDLAGNRATDVVRAAGRVLEPDEVATFVTDAIAAERFLVLPHPEVADYEALKTADRDRWLAGMRKLQRRVLGSD